MFDFLGKLIDTGVSAWNASENREQQEKINAQNLAQQREFAQHGIRWKVADAQAAGLHPLAALGAQTSSFSNLVGSSQEVKSDFGGMGQSLDRAIAAGSTASERDAKMSAAVSRVAQTFQLERLNLENEMLKTNIAKERGQLGPPFPGNWVNMVSGGPNRTTPGGLAVKEKEIEQQAAAHPEVGTYNLLGMNLKTNPMFSDANTLENRGGEGIGDFLGWANIPADILYTHPWLLSWITKQYGPNLLDEMRGGDRSRYSRAQRTMRGR